MCTSRVAFVEILKQYIYLTPSGSICSVVCGDAPPPHVISIPYWASVCSKVAALLDKSEIPIWFSQSNGTNSLVQIGLPPSHHSTPSQMVNLEYFHLLHFINLTWWSTCFYLFIYFRSSILVHTPKDGRVLFRNPTNSLLLILTRILVNIFNMGI